MSNQQESQVMTGRDVGHYMLSERERRRIKGSRLSRTLRDAAYIPFMCFEMYGTLQGTPVRLKTCA